MNQREIKLRYILRHKGKIKIVFATIEEIERGKMDKYLMQKSEKFRGEDEVIARNRWTGRNDRKNKEIYEWDIVERRGRAELVEWWIDAFTTYSKSYGRYSLACHNLFYDEGMDAEIECWEGKKEKDLKIIGNIYENSKLLEK